MGLICWQGTNYSFKSILNFMNILENNMVLNNTKFCSTLQIIFNILYEM